MVKTIFVAVTLAASMLLAGCSGGTTTSEPEPPLICTVSDKAQSIEVTGSGDSTSSKQVYFVYSDCGVFQVFSLWDGQGAELYNKIQVGKTYEFEAFGPRASLLGMYPQITAVTPIG